MQSEETMAFNNQEAFGNNVNQQVDQVQQTLDAAQRLHEMLGMGVKKGSRGVADRIRQLQQLRDFVSIKEPTSGFDPQIQLKAIDHELARLQAAGKQRPVVQSSEDNQRGK